MDCWQCKSPLIWNNDFTYEDYCMEGDGMVTILTCSNEKCDVEEVRVYTSNEPKEKDE